MNWLFQRLAKFIRLNYILTLPIWITEALSLTFATSCSRLLDKSNFLLYSTLLSFVACHKKEIPQDQRFTSPKFCLIKNLPGVRISIRVRNRRRVNIYRILGLGSELKLARLGLVSESTSGKVTFSLVSPAPKHLRNSTLQ